MIPLQSGIFLRKTGSACHLLPGGLRRPRNRGKSDKQFVL
jgi:hypothetical protein